LGLDLATLSGSGPGGRIQSHDVRRAAEAEPLMVTPALVAETPSARVISRQIPLSRMRRTIADRLTASQRDVPQFIVSMAVEMSRAQQMIADLATASDEVRVTLTAFLIKACGWALERHPALNASFGPEAITEWADINIGMAVSVEQGLVVPVIRQADRLPILEIARQVSELGQRARQGKLQPHEMQGGTFTISNLGMFGVDHFTAIINPPEAAILAVSRAAKVPVVSDDDKIAIKLLADLSLTADHRVVDGAQAAQFLAALKQAIERPGLLL
jgi:pyruvate dehydrogenase E2 component (dihydrolipoamide acetyltransferase)